MFKFSTFLRCLLIISYMISTQITGVVLEDFLEESKPTLITESQRLEGEKYLKKLKETKKEWVDPNSMLKAEEKNIDSSSESVTEYQRMEGEKYLKKLKETKKERVDPNSMLKAEEKHIDSSSESVTEYQRMEGEKYLKKLKETKKERVDPNSMLKAEEKNIDLFSESVTEYQRKQGEKYLQKLRETTKQWVDPYDMLKTKEKKLDLSSENSYKMSTVSITTKLAMESDFKPTFSDIRGEIIDGKSVADDDILPTSDHEKDSGKILSDTRQEICVLDSIYVTRWLKKLIIKLESYSNSEPTSLTFSVNRDTLDMLQKISESKALDIGDLDDLICQLINKAVVNYGGIDWESLIPSVMNNSLILVALFCILCFMYAFYNGILYYTKSTVFFCIIALSVFWHWMRLYQQKIAHKHAALSALTISNQCVQTDMGILEHISFYIKSSFSSVDCKKYYEAVMVDAIWEVSISVAVADAVTAFFFQPLEVIARAINSGLKYLFQDLSAFAVLGLIIFIFIFTVMLCNYKIKLPFFLGSLEPGTHSAGSSIEDINVRKTNKTKRLFLSNAESLSRKLGLDATVVDADPPCRKHSCSSKDIILVGRNDGCCQTAESRFKNVKTCMITNDRGLHKILHKSDHHFKDSSCCSTELVDDFKRVQTCSCRSENVFSSVKKECQCCCSKGTIDEIEQKATETCITRHNKFSMELCVKPEVDEKTSPSAGEPAHLSNISVNTKDSLKDCCDKNVKDIYVTNYPKTLLIQSANVEDIPELASDSLDL